MAAGDGLLVRVRPHLACLSRGQVAGLCAASLAFGNGRIDATRRANLQLRGVSEAGWPALVERLIALDLVDADPAIDARRNILVAPGWVAGDDIARIADALAARLGALPNLPGKAGFAIDAGPAPVLADSPADFRIERSADGRLLLRADGRPTGAPLPHGGEADALIALATWFVASGGAAAGRMARHHVPLPEWAHGTIPPAASAVITLPGRHPLGTAYGLPFGAIDAAALAALVEARRATALRVTPWRTIILEGDAAGAPTAGFVTDPASPLLRVDACPGAPACPQATVATRPLAQRLASHATGTLHVSGCAKGCARSAPADVTLTGRDGRFDLARNARAGAPPAAAALAPVDIPAWFGAA